MEVKFYVTMDIPQYEEDGDYVYTELHIRHALSDLAEELAGEITDLEIK